MARLRTVGVLGGMGPEATILLQQKLLTRVRANDDADHIPLLIDMNPQVPSRITYLLDKTGDDPGPILTHMAQRLQAAGAEALVMPCNTAHCFAGAISNAVNIPLLNLIDLAVDHAASALGPGGRIGLLASPALHRTGLYDETLKKKGLTAVWPTSMDAMLAAIRAIKSGGDQLAIATDLTRISGELSDAGAEMQLVACSEFSIIAGHLPAEANAIDTIDLLADATARFSLNGQSPT